jgi:hypothetical protein
MKHIFNLLILSLCFSIAINAQPSSTLNDSDRVSAELIVFGDAIALDDDQPNGLLQTEINSAFKRTLKKENTLQCLYNIMAGFNISKIGNQNRTLPVNIDTIKFIHIFNEYKYSWFNAYLKANLFHFWTSNSGFRFYLDAIGTYYSTRLSDSLSKDSEYNIGSASLGGIFTIQSYFTNTILNCELSFSRLNYIHFNNSVLAGYGPIYTPFSDERNNIYTPAKDDNKKLWLNTIKVLFKFYPDKTDRYKITFLKFAFTLPDKSNDVSGSIYPQLQIGIQRDFATMFSKTN